MMIVTDGFNDIRAKLLPSTKSALKERYPSFCQLKAESLTHFLIAITKYSFCLKQRGSFALNRSALQVVVEIEAMRIVMAERVRLSDMNKRTFRSKYTREIIEHERKTP